MNKITTVARRGTAVALSAILLAGCSFGQTGTALRSATGAEADASHFMEQARTPDLPDATVHSVRVVDDVFTTATVSRNDHGSPLPRRWEVPGLTMNIAQPLPLYDIGSLITSQTGIPVSFSPDAMSGAPIGANAQPNTSKGGVLAAGPATPPRPGDINALLGSLNAAGNTSGSEGNEIRAVIDDQVAMKAHFTGRLSEFLNQLGSHFGVTWEYTNGQIRIFRNVTRTFTVHALPLDLNMQSTLSTQSATLSASGGSSGGTTGGSAQQAASNVNLKLWDDIKAALASIIGNEGLLSIGVSTGTITVTAPPAVIERVETYMDMQNKRMSKQVAVSIQVYNITITNSDQFNLNLQGVFNKSSKYGFSFGNATTSSGLAGLVASGSSATVPGLAANILSPTSAFSGSSSVIGALSTLGKVSVVTTTSITTLNGIPAPVQVANTRGYLASVATTVTPSGTGNTTSTTLTPGSVTTGYNLSLLPRVSETGDSLLLSFAVNISDLNGATNGFDVYTTPDKTESVELPNVNTRSFVQQAEVNSGQSLVLSGFEQTTDNATKSGSGTPDNFLLGGGQSGSRQRDLIVIVLTPTIIEKSFITAN
jgi:type IVB pilus formation R64 PilN family outer membrane protein